MGLEDKDLGFRGLGFRDMWFWGVKDLGFSGFRVYMGLGVKDLGVGFEGFRV